MPAFETVRSFVLQLPLLSHRLNSLSNRFFIIPPPRITAKSGILIGNKNWHFFYLLLTLLSGTKKIHHKFQEIVMPEKKINIPSIACGHCLNTVKTELTEIDGVLKVEGDVDSKDVTITWQAPAKWDSIEALLKEIGYPAA
jgi:copper chaperone CopZ